MVKVVKKDGETKKDAIERMISELTAQKKSILAEDRGKARKMEDRKKILIGSFFVAHPDRLDMLLNDPAFEKHFTRRIDREVFGFVPLPEEPKTEKQTQGGGHEAASASKPSYGEFTVKPDREIL